MQQQVQQGGVTPPRTPLKNFKQAQQGGVTPTSSPSRSRKALSPSPPPNTEVKSRNVSPNNNPDANCEKRVSSRESRKSSLKRFLGKLPKIKPTALVRRFRSRSWPNPLLRKKDRGDRGDEKKRRKRSKSLPLITSLPLTLDTAFSIDELRRKPRKENTCYDSDRDDEIYWVRELLCCSKTSCYGVVLRPYVVRPYAGSSHSKSRTHVEKHQFGRKKRGFFTPYAGERFLAFNSLFSRRRCTRTKWRFPHSYKLIRGSRCNSF